MPIVTAAVVPHSPLLIPTIAKEHASAVASTVTEVEKVAADIYASQPNVVVVLTPHGETHPGSIVVHTAETFHGGFATFGDISTTITAQAAQGLTHKLKSAAEHAHLPCLLRTFDELDYGVSVPLYYVLHHQPNLAVIPLSLPHHDHDILLRTGAVLREFCMTERARIAIIASCDFSRVDKPSSRAQRRPTSEERQLSNAIASVDPAAATAMTPATTTCGYGPLVTLLAAVHGLVQQGRVTSFTAPLGVGLLTATFDLSS